jgi:hypothetical protein
MAVAFTIRLYIVVPFSCMWSNAGAARRLPGMMPPIKLVRGAAVRGADALMISDRGESKDPVDLRTRRCRSKPSPADPRDPGRDAGAPRRRGAGLASAQCGPGGRARRRPGSRPGGRPRAGPTGSANAGASGRGAGVLVGPRVPCSPGEGRRRRRRRTLSLGTSDAAYGTLQDHGWTAPRSRPARLRGTVSIGGNPPSGPSKLDDRPQSELVAAGVAERETPIAQLTQESRPTTM